MVGVIDRIMIIANCASREFRFTNTLSKHPIKLHFESFYFWVFQGLKM